MKKVQVFEPADPMPKDKSSLLTISNKFGLTFVGLDRTFKVYLTQDILAADKADGNSYEVGKNMSIQIWFTFYPQRYTAGCATWYIFVCVLVKGIAALAEVTVELTLHHLALSCDELTLSVCGTAEEAGLFLTFYDVRTFLNKVTILVHVVT